ncbi:MAG: uroporphyrinogen decarboxylase family protein [Candidatus Bipolaricaulia bacterium]
MAMTAQDRVMTALQHKEPDRVPFDLDGTTVSGIHRIAYRNLLSHIGMDEESEISVYDIVTHRNQVEALSQKTGCALTLVGSGSGIFEYACWIRGFKEFYLDLARDPSLATSLLDKITDYKIRIWELLLDELGHLAQIAQEADDLAGQVDLLISPDMYRQLIKPRHKRVFEFIKKNAPKPMYVFLHSDGAIYDLIPDLIEAGVQILNPVQVSAARMDTRRLKKEFGDVLCFWGGGVDTQNVLPRGTPDEVRDEVRRHLDDLAPGGGYIFGAIHNIQPDVPPENIIAMWETLQEYGRY